MNREIFEQKFLSLTCQYLVEKFTAASLIDEAYSKLLPAYLQTLIIHPTIQRPNLIL